MNERNQATSPPDADNVGDYLISSRSFHEYEAMFSLTESDFRGRLLDCPGGASSFTAEASARGVEVTAVDPVYAMPVRDLQNLIMGEPDRGSIHALAGVDRYRWDFYGDPEGHREMRNKAATVFSRDFEVHGERYVAASLPDLPYEDHHFDLVLSSHFLFTYSDRLDEDFHYRALIELHRICRRQVRVFPLLHQSGSSLSSTIDALIARLARQGVRAELRDVSYEFQRGGSQMLVLSPT